MLLEALLNMLGTDQQPPPTELEEWRQEIQSGYDRSKDLAGRTKVRAGFASQFTKAYNKAKDYAGYFEREPEEEPALKKVAQLATDALDAYKRLVLANEIFLSLLSAEEATSPTIKGDYLQLHRQHWTELKSELSALAKRAKDDLQSKESDEESTEDDDAAGDGDKTMIDNSVRRKQPLQQQVSEQGMQGAIGGEGTKKGRTNQPFSSTLNLPQTSSGRSLLSDAAETLQNPPNMDLSFLNDYEQQRPGQSTFLGGNLFNLGPVGQQPSTQPQETAQQSRFFGQPPGFTQPQSNSASMSWSGYQRQAAAPRNEGFGQQAARSNQPQPQQPPPPPFSRQQNAPMRSMMAAPTQQAAAGNQDFQGHFLQMFSHSIASTFNIATIIPKKFDGTPGEYPDFIVLWQKADAQMAAMGFEKANRFWELKKVLTGSALAYVQALPIALDNSYDEALTILDKLYSEKKNVLRTLVKNLIASPVCSGSIAERQKFHANIVAYYQGVKAVQASDQQTRLAIELSLIEARLDDNWRREWFKFCSRRKDNSPLGANVTPDDLLMVLYESLAQQITLQQARELGPRQKKEEKKANAAGATKVKASANATVAGKFNKNQKDSTQGKGDCPFCTSNGKQKFKHKFPLGCPLVNPKSKEKNKMPLEEIKKVIKEKGLCKNCFNKHLAKNCDAPDSIKCQTCGKKHSTILHQDRPTAAAAAAAAAAPPQDEEGQYQRE